MVICGCMKCKSLNLSYFFHLRLHLQSKFSYCKLQLVICAEIQRYISLQISFFSLSKAFFTQVIYLQINSKAVKSLHKSQQAFLSLDYLWNLCFDYQLELYMRKKIVRILLYIIHKCTLCYISNSKLNHKSKSAVKILHRKLGVSRSPQFDYRMVQLSPKFVSLQFSSSLCQNDV